MYIRVRSESPPESTVKKAVSQGRKNPLFGCSVDYSGNVAVQSKSMKEIKL